MCALVIKKQSERIFHKINGLICIYKPPSMKLNEVSQKLKYMFVKTLNDLPCRSIKKMVKIDDENNKIYITKNLADSPLAVGPRYIQRDFEIEYLHPLATESSGVQSRLGVATDDFSPEGRIIEKSTYDHVTRASIDRIMSAIQSTYQREMYHHFGLDLKSQKAYDLASIGLLRPVDHSTSPIIYAIKCIKYVKPFFTLEITIINEKTPFLKELIHDIGYRLKTNAICIEIKRVRDGFIDSTSSLAHIEWDDINKILDNMRLMNNKAYENLVEFNNTVLIGKSRQEADEMIKNDGDNIQKKKTGFKPIF